MFRTFELSFPVDILTFFDLATIWATLFKIRRNCFLKSSGHTDFSLKLKDRENWRETAEHHETFTFYKISAATATTDGI
jgi:hypothetical protein